MNKRNVKDIVLVIVVPCQVADGEIIPEMDAPWHGIPLLTPTSALTVAGFARAAGIRMIRIWDEFVEGMVTEETFSDVDLCFLSWLTPSRLGAFRVAKLAKTMGVSVVGGGLDVTCMSAADMLAELHSHIPSLGVGRLTTPEMIEILSDALDGVLKSVYKADDEDPWEFFKTPFWLIDLDKYLFAGVETSRGCDKCCGFCMVGMVTGVCKVHHKPTETVRKDLLYLAMKGIKLVAFTDDAFGTDYDRAMSDYLPLCWEFHAKCGMQYFAEMHIPAMIGKGTDRKELITPMKKAGFIVIYFGFETLKNIGKNDLDDADLAISLCRKNHILTAASNIIDFSGDETLETVEETVNWLLDRGVLGQQQALLVLIPGTPWYEKAEAEGKIINRDPRAMDGSKPTRQHNVATPEELVAWLARAYHLVFPKKSEHIRWLKLVFRIIRTMGWNPRAYSVAFKTFRHIQRSLDKWEKLGKFTKVN